MNINNTSTTPYTTQAHFSALPAQAKAAKFKELTGWEIDKNGNGDFTCTTHPESTQRLSFMGEFFHVGFNSPDGFEAAIKNLARKYSKLREGLLERYSDNQYELYRQLGELNQAFENALRSTTLLPQPSMPSSGIGSSNMPQNIQDAIKSELQKYESIKNFMQTLQQNMMRHLDIFFEIFIHNIQSSDFDTAFTHTMETLAASESTSLSDMSFRDMVLIRDTLFEGRYELDEDGNEVFILNNPADSIFNVIRNTDISHAIRRELADSLGFNHLHVPTKEQVAERARLIAEHETAMANREPVMPQFSHTINLGTAENPKWATIRPNQIIITTENGHHFDRNHTILDLDEGMEGISASTLQKLRYMQMLVQGKNNGTGNGNPNINGRPLQNLNALVFNISIAFGEIASQSGTNNAALQNAFRDMVLSLFDDAVMTIHGQTEDAEELEQLRQESRDLGQAFLNRFFTKMRTLTPQNLSDTGMTRSELAFHEAINFIYFEVGMSVLGGSVTSGSNNNSPQHFGLDGKPIIFQSEEEFRRLTIEMLMQVARDNAEIYRQWAEMRAEEAKRLRKIMLIAARIASGDNVPPQDKKFLMANSPGMYMIAKAARARVESENPQNHKSLISDEEQDAVSAEVLFNL
ncbi:MAG: hypothetical protein FWE24_02360 [Defluviitaleaceae bacterium]|nr:hypothetical protein [Defluviitaleaceae bacterium]